MSLFNLKAVQLPAVALVASFGLAACGPLHAPSLPFGGQTAKQKVAASRAKVKGERIPVLSLNKPLEASPALKGIGFSIAPAQENADWTMSGGNATHAMEHVKGGAALQVAWRKRIGDGDTVDAHITAQPVVSDGVIYTLDGHARITALNAQTGATIWSVNLAPKRVGAKDAFGGGLAVDKTAVYVTSGYRFAAALDVKTGALMWQTPTRTPLHGAPNLSGGKLFVVDTLDQLHAIDAATGTEAWTYQALEEPARMQVASSPAVDNDIVVAPFASGELTAVRTANGNDAWSYVLSLTNRNNALSEIRDIAGLPVIYRGDVVAGSHSGVFAAVDIRTGQPRWSQPITSVSSPWVSGDVVYITDQAGQVICLSRDAGQAYWIQGLNKGLRKKLRSVWSGPLLSSDRLLLVSSRGELRALDPHTGEKVGSLRLGPSAFLSPIAAGSLVYVLADNGELIAVR
jgi:outer membrane protein assembly factor BamB